MLFRPNRRFTLAQVWPRQGNQWARAAGIRFIQALQVAHPVLLIEGRPGTGKTQLLHALVNLAAANPTLEHCACLSAVQFGEEVMRGHHYNDLHEVLDRYAATSLLAIDDVDRLLYQRVVADALLQVLPARAAARRRTLLVETRCERPVLDHGLVAYLAAQPKVTVH